jgi:hypothetical protein
MMNRDVMFSGFSFVVCLFFPLRKWSKFIGYIVLNVYFSLIEKDGVK